MSRTIHKTDNPVTLDGFQAILAPSKFGYSLSAVVCEDIVNTLEDERNEQLKWAESKLKNPKRSKIAMGKMALAGAACWLDVWSKPVCHL